MYLLTCVYKEAMSSKFGGKPYGFLSDIEVEEGLLTIVNDRYGFSLVRVISSRPATNEEVESGFYKPVVDLEKINLKIKEVKLSKQNLKENVI